MHSVVVTVITPCFDDGATISTALASLMAQTVGDWECVIVDDGSVDSVSSVLEAFDEPRFRLISLSQNQGRAVARQQALNAARGEYICMLDADDWYYPRKLEWQLEVMEERQDLVAVGSGAAVIGDSGELMGIRASSPDRLELRVGQHHRLPRIFCPSVMIRRDRALAYSFDPRLERSEDRDYMMRVLAGQRYAILPEVLYAYRETFSEKSMREAMCGFHNQRRIFCKRFVKAPVVMARQYVLSLVKSGIYGAARLAGRGEWLFTRRNRAATTEERRRFLASREQVWKARDSVRTAVSAAE